jgi:hypothetical protein
MAAVYGATARKLQVQDAGSPRDVHASVVIVCEARFGWTDQRSLSNVRAVHDMNSSRPDAPAPATLEPVRFGEFLRDRHMITDEQWLAALADHWSVLLLGHRRMIGTTIIENGYLSAEAVESEARRFHDDLDVVEIDTLDTLDGMDTLDEVSPRAERATLPTMLGHGHGHGSSVGQV